MAKRFNRSRGFKGSKFLGKCKSGGKTDKKSRRIELDDAPSPSPTFSDDAYGKHVNATCFDSDEEEEERLETEEEEEMEVQKETSMYDNLLKRLEPSGKSHAQRHLKRKSKDEDGSDFDEEYDLKGRANNSDVYNGVRDVTKSSGVASDLSINDDDDDDDDDDAESGFRDNNGLASTSKSISKFNLHIAHKLVQQDRDTLSKTKWKYNWEMPALDSTNCKWMGTGECNLKDADAAETSPYGLKPKLYKHWLEVYGTSGGNNFQSSKQILFFSLCNSYRDILHHNKKAFYQKRSDEDSSIMDAYIMHSLNHIFRSRDIVKKNNARLSKHQETAMEEVITNENFLDQGYTRPKVLLLLPFASIALRVVRRLIQLTPSANKVNVEHLERFEQEFGVAVDQEEDELEAKDSKTQKPSKPSDYQALFGGNNDDHFMVGIKFTKKSIRLYHDFYSSDMIIASPLRLITKIGEAEVNKEKDLDYLSSIEILVIDHADVIAMQNWSHVNTAIEHLNHIPSKQHGTDIMRVRRWYLDGDARFYRQSIVLSSYLNPDINAFFNRHCLNFEGKLRLSCEYKGVLPKVVLPVRQVYERFDVDSLVEADDARLEYFVKKVYPKIKDSVQGGILLFISSYFEYRRIWSFLASHNASFCLLGDHTSQRDISRARNWFIQGQRKIMLYTERAHFYHRYKIRGIKNLIIYSLPERKEFYPEVLNMFEGSHNMTCTALFSRFDLLRLERIVGTAAAKRMTTSDKGVFIFS